MSLLDFLREGLLNTVMGTRLVCLRCLRTTDVVVGDAGDFSLCERCHASITRRTGKTVRASRYPNRRTDP